MIDPGRAGGLTTRLVTGNCPGLAAGSHVAHATTLARACPPQRTCMYMYEYMDVCMYM